MFGQTILILPFGILPFVLLAAYLLWKVLEATGQRTITNDRRFGKTEFPTEPSALLCGVNRDELAFTEDGKSIILTIKGAYPDLADIGAAQRYIEEKLSRQYDMDQAWAGHLVVTRVVRNEEPRGCEVTITMPRSTILSIEYIEKEIKNLGCVFERSTVNDHRSLTPAREPRLVEVNNGRVLVRSGRIQLLPTLLGNWKEGVMSERQITRNIKNRLWNQVEVRCITIDRQAYCGEIVLSATK